MAAELHTKVSGNVDQQIQSLRLEGDARTALYGAKLAMLEVWDIGAGHQRRQRTLSCTILRSRMRILAKCEKSAVGQMSAFVASDSVEAHRQPTSNAKDV